MSNYKNLNSREGELTTVVNRHKFDEVPGDVTCEKDIERWHNFRKEYHEAHRLETHTDFPLQVDFELTSQCNMKCSFCVHGYEKVPKRKLTFESFCKVIDEGEKYGLCSIKLNYINEPLLTPDIEKYIAYAKSKGVLNIYFATNGSLLNAKNQQKLIDAKLSKVMISLDAITSEVFEAMRNNKKFDVIVKNIHDFIALRNSLGLTYPLVRVNFVKTQLNIHEQDEFIKYWSSVADTIGFQDQVGIPNVDKSEQPDAHLSLSLPVIQGGLTCGTADTPNIVTAKQDSDSVFNLPDNTNPRKGFRCSFPYKMLVIDSGGNILPCCTFSGRELPLGNIETTTLKEAWDSKKMRDLKKLQLEGKYEQNEVCKHCVNSSGAHL